MSTPPDPCKCCKPRYIKFQLNYDLTTATASQEAQVKEYWDGIPPDDAGSPWVVTVYNLQRLIGSYTFSGATNEVGYAVWDDVEDKYKIFYMPQGADGVYGYGRFAPADNDLPSATGDINDLALLTSNTVNAAYHGTPAVTFEQDGAMKFRKIIANATGIYTVHFRVSVRLASPGSSYLHKQATVTGTVNLSTGNINSGAVTSNLCSNEFFIRRTFKVLKNTDISDPNDTTDLLIAANVWNNYECGRLSYFDFMFSDTLDLTTGDELTIWYDRASDVGTASGLYVAYSTSLTLHFSDEPL